MGRKRFYFGKAIDTYSQTYMVVSTDRAGQVAHRKDERNATLQGLPLRRLHAPPHGFRRLRLSRGRRVRPRPWPVNQPQRLLHRRHLSAKESSVNDDFPLWLKILVALAAIPALYLTVAL